MVHDTVMTAGFCSPLRLGATMALVIIVYAGSISVLWNDDNKSI
jgi:hypothetical protein